jgi:aclacinomycin oxidase
MSARRYKVKAAYLRRSFTGDQLATIYQYLSAPSDSSGGGMLLVGYGGQV